MNTLSEFFRMGGYAFYVWSAVGVTLAVLAWNAVLPGLRERRLLRRLKQQGDGS